MEVLRGDLRIYFEVVGHGPRLLLFNGSGASIETSRLIIDRLASEFEVAVHDQRGLGRTGLPPSGSTGRMSDYAADGAAVLDEMGWPVAAILGISFGGMVAQEFAVTWPERVSRLALLCTSAGGGGGSSYPLHELWSLPPEERVKTRLHILDTRFSAKWLRAHPSDQLLVDFIEARELRDRTPDEARGLAAQLGARSQHDVWDRLQRITCPTLVACGHFDGIAPPANSEAIASRITGSILKCYEGGHAFIAQDPDAWPDALAFFKGADGERVESPSRSDRLGSEA